MWIFIGGLLALALALAARSGLVALRTRRLERQRRQLLEDVGLLQTTLLPVPPVRLGPVGTSAAYQPADGPAAGGDFYDVFAAAARIAVLVPIVMAGAILGDFPASRRAAGRGNLCRVLEPHRRYRLGRLTVGALRDKPYEHVVDRKTAWRNSALFACAGIREGFGDSQAALLYVIVSWICTPSASAML